MKSWTVIAAAFLGLTAANPITPANPLVRREKQETAIYNCEWPAPISNNYYDTLDPGADVCNPDGGDLDVQELKAGQNFAFKSYGTKCRFFVDRDWASAGIGEAFGHADCPGVKDIKGLKADGVDHDSGDGMDVRHKVCWVSYVPPIMRNVYCYSRIRLSWDGCLSCGDPVD